MRVPHIDTHTSFVLCDQMMRVAMKLVTSIQQCPILFCSHPYYSMWHFFWCFVSTFPQSVCQLHGIVLQWNMDATTPSMFERSSLTMKYWGGSHGMEIIIHFASFTSLVSNKSKSFWICVLLAAVSNLSYVRWLPFDVKQSNFEHKTRQIGSIDHVA